MSSVSKFAQNYAGLKAREERYREEARRRAKELAREDRIAVYKELHELIRVSKVPISKVCDEAGISRASVYRWLEEYDRLMGYVVDPATVEVEWSDVKLMPNGEVSAVDSGGSSWLLSPDGEAWNRTENKTIEGFGDWPFGAKEVLDGAIQA